jgi:hypothetical protein
MKLVHDFVFPNNLHFNQLYLCYAVLNYMLLEQTFILLCHNDKFENDGEIEKQQHLTMQPAFSQPCGR